MTTSSIVLPCGMTVIVGEFTGVAQRHIHDVLKALEAREAPALDWQDKVLLEVVSKLGAKEPRERDLLALAAGSRLRIMIEARRRTYGDDLEMEWVCRCGAKNQRTLNLAELADTPYPDPPHAHFRASSGQVFTLAWGTGLTEREFARASMRREVSFLDEPLSRITALDGEPKGPRVIMKLSARILDEVRRAGRAMVPVFDPEAAPRTEGAGEEDVHDTVTDPARMPTAGCPEWVRLPCESCGARGLVPVATQPDFLLRGVREAAD